MQYNHKVEIKYVEAFDDYGQPLDAPSKSLRCCILSESLTNSKTDAKQKNQYDMTILVGAKTYAPYSRLFEDKLVRIAHDKASEKIT